MEEKIIESAVDAATKELLMDIGHQSALLDVASVIIKDQAKAIKFWKKAAMIESLVIAGLIAFNSIKPKKIDIPVEDFGDDFNEI